MSITCSFSRWPSWDSQNQMVVLSLLSVLVPVGALLVLILLALWSTRSPEHSHEGSGDDSRINRPSGLPERSHQAATGPRGGPQVEEPDWWPEFEREFALYVARMNPSSEARQSADRRPRRPRRRLNPHAE